MISMSYTSARGNFASTIEKVRESHAPITITRQGKGVAVMMSIEDYQALEETAYLLRSPKNAQRLLSAINDLESGKGSPQELGE